MSVDKPSEQHSYNQKKSGPTTQSKASTMKEHQLEQSQATRVIENEDKSVSNSRKVRRAFSMPRNPFRWSRKFKTTNKDEAAEINTANQQQQPVVGGGNEGKHCLEAPSTASRVLRRSSSFRKFLTRIAQHVSSVSFGAKHSSAPNGPDRVPPLGGYQWPADQTPGVTGLKNHGNTCFMNAVLQCLSHTDILAEYFVLDQYKADLKRRNKLNSRKFGTKGELTEQLANVLKALWTCKNETDHSTSFKAVVDRYGSQFRSSTQHDAQEFLFWLLDKVHEDLNTATKRRYKTIKNNYGRPDEIIAAETLANHIRCNNSFVQAVFQAQFRSSLTCNRCHKQSNTFDPFHCISVQLPQLSQQTIFVTVLYVTQHPRQVKLGLTVPPGSPIVALREQLHADTGIAVNRMVLVDINETGFCRVFCDSQPISTLDGIHSLYCIEIPDIKQTESSSELLLLIANVKKDENAVTRFGTPFCMQVNRDCTYVELQKKILKELSAVLKPEVFAYTTPTTEMFQIRLQDPSADPDTYLEQVEHPLLTEMIDMALSVLSSDAGPAHVKLLLEWSDSDRFFSDLSDPIVEHESVSQLKDNSANQTVLTLEQCLEHYTKAETLSAEDAWRCPNCQQYLPVVKTLGLWSLPDILVIHFKRFRQQHDKGPEAAKLTTMVKFPLNAFDMSPHLARGSSSSDSLDRDDVGRPLMGNSPWRKTRDHHKGKDKEMKDNRYDLYAVCYHQGDTLETGHYTAACKNPYDHLWYKFDDQRVNQVPAEDIPEQIVNNEAYILFYQRRKVDTTECSGTSSTSGDHWVSRIAIPSAPLGGSCCSSSAFVGNGGNEKQVEHEEPNATANAKEINSDTTKPGEENKLKDRVPHDAVFIEKTDETEVIDVENIEFADDEEKLSANKVQAQVEIVATPSKLIEKPSALDEKKLEEIEMVELTKAGKSVAVAEIDDGNAILNASTTKKPKETEAEKNKELRSNSSSSNEFSPKPLWPTTKLRSSYNENIQQQRSGLNFPEAFSNSIRSTSTMAAAAASLGHSGDTSLRHSFSTSSSYKLKDCDALSMIRNAGSSCSKDTLLYIDQQNHSLIDDDDSFLGGRSLWISPVTPHKLITVSPKN